MAAEVPSYLYNLPFDYRDNPVLAANAALHDLHMDRTPARFALKELVFLGDPSTPSTAVMKSREAASKVEAKLGELQPPRRIAKDGFAKYVIPGHGYQIFTEVDPSAMPPARTPKA